MLARLSPFTYAPATHVSGAVPIDTRKRDQARRFVRRQERTEPSWIVLDGGPVYAEAA